MSGARRLLMTGGGGGSGWSPADFSSLHAWWDGDDASTFSYSTGTAVSQWRDKSGNGRHLGLGSSPDRSGTINGRTVPLFSSSFLRINTTMVTWPATILAVARNTAASGQRDLIMPLSTGDGRVFRTTGGTIDMYQNSFLSSGVSWGTANAHSVVAVFNGASSKIAVDSGAYTTGTAGGGSFGTTGWIVGAFQTGTSEFWAGEICEIVVLDVEVGASNLTEWWSYCAAKWGTP